MLDRSNLEIEYVFIDSEPLGIYFIPRWDNKSYILVTEDPFDGACCRVISKKEKNKISKKIAQSIKNQES